jgi:putative phage-type endonuclease
MIKYHNEIQQNTDEWLKLRLGIITASNVKNLVTASNKPAKNQTTRNYANDLAAQRETGCNEDHYESYDMIRGSAQEEIARDIYSDNISEVKECGFITNTDHGFTIGCSPDGLVGDDGGIEIKSRLAKFQIATILADEVPAEYMKQIQTFLIVSGRKWCDFVQYSNGLPLFVKRVYPDEEMQAIILDALKVFELEVDFVLTEYRLKSAGMIQTDRVDWQAETLMGEIV